MAPPVNPDVIIRKNARIQIRDLARQNTLDAWRAIEDALAAETPTGKPDHDIRLRAAGMMLDRAWGKPTVEIQHTDGRLEQLKDAMRGLSPQRLAAMHRELSLGLRGGNDNRNTEYNEPHE